MRTKLIAIGLISIFLWGCNNENMTEEEVFSQTNNFGVGSETTLKKLEKTVELKKVGPNIYSSSKAPKPYHLFEKYFYKFKDGRLCSVQGVAYYDANNTKERDIKYKELIKKFQDIYYVPGGVESINADIAIWGGMSDIYNVMLYKPDNNSAVGVMINYLEPKNIGNPNGC